MENYKDRCTTISELFGLFLSFVEASSTYVTNSIINVETRSSLLLKFRYLHPESQLQSALAFVTFSLGCNNGAKSDIFRMKGLLPAQPLQYQYRPQPMYFTFTSARPTFLDFQRSRGRSNQQRTDSFDGT